MTDQLNQEQADLLSFQVNGEIIRNPFLSACGLQAVDPRQYGFQERETGGHCMALVKELESGHSLWLTDDSGCELPDLSDPASALYGRYDEEREEMVCCSISQLRIDGAPKQEKAAGPRLR